jgi:hypothetical protein
VKAKTRGGIAERTLSRRTLLEWLGTGTVLTLGGSALVGCLGDTQLAPAGDGGPDGSGQTDGGAGGDYAPGEFPFTPGGLEQGVYSNWGERTVDRQDLQAILDSWRLTVDGLVEQPRVYTFADLVALPREDMLVDFHCVEGWSVYDVPWNGLHLERIFEQVRPLAAATHVTFHTIGDEYNENLPLPIARETRTRLCYGIGGQTLPLKHGFPLRIVIPRLLGYKNAKYVYRIELTDREEYGYWVAAGYPYAGEVPANRLRPDRY